MKTQKEIEEMKRNVQDKIEVIETELSTEWQNSIVSNLLDRKRQLMAQYNILLEVLK